MTALSLHHAVFTKINMDDSDFSMRSATPFLRPAPDRDATPTSQLFSSTAYQDIIQRQPTHPDGPTLGWDLGLNLLGDPATVAEHKSLEGYQTKIKLRRLRATNIVLELLFGLWGTYTTVRYCIAFTHGAGNNKDSYSLALGILSALAVALVIGSFLLMPFFPRRSHSRAWRYARAFARACYLLLLSTAAITNLVLVVLWHPDQFCDWDIDVLWYTPIADSDATPCHPAPFAAWITAGILRLVVTSTITLVFIYTMRSYSVTRHPISDRRAQYSAFFASDPEELSPMSTSSPFHLSKSTHKLTQWEGSSHTVYRSNPTLPKYNSISTLAPSTSCGHSRSHSTLPCKDTPPPRISPPTSRSASGHVTNHTPRLGSDGQFRANSVTDPSTIPPMLRRTSRITVTRANSDTTLSDVASLAEKVSSQAIARDPSENRSWKPGHRGIPVHVDLKKTSESHFRQASHTSTGSTTLSATTHEDGESVQEKGRDDGLACGYGYGVSGPTYPYLDMYNPSRPERHEETWACEDGPSQGHRQPCLSFGPTYADVPPASSPSSRASSREDGREDDYEYASSDEDEEYVAMMGGFVRRMATIESLGSKEATGTLSTCSVARHHRETSPSRFSTGRFSAYHGSSTGASSNGHPSLESTLYFSLSSGGTGVGASVGGMRVNERGELLPGPSHSEYVSRSAASSPYDRRYFTASGSSFERATEDEDREG